VSLRLNSKLYKLKHFLDQSELLKLTRWSGTDKLLKNDYDIKMDLILKIISRLISVPAILAFNK
jgi:hypothetical protein